MNTFFNISEQDMLDSTKIKIIEGIAGSAKSSNIDRFFKDRGITYGRYTSTNRLKRDAITRYGCFCDTIAGGLFHTDRGRFFAEAKEPEFESVVIDEILQTHTRVFQWIKENRGKINIIVTTDEKQMLTKSFGELILSEFCKLKQEPYSIVSELKKTYRARDKKTEKYYYDLYDSVGLPGSKFFSDCKYFPQIRFSEMRYNHNDVYITHSNDLELMLFREYDLYHDYTADLLQKGAIARRGEIKNPEKYPILPQLQVPQENLAYLQLANVGTPTRYQGSEVDRAQKLYFLVRDSDYVSNREWYTVITRAWTIDSIVIVRCDDAEMKPLTEFCGKPVKKVTWGSLTEDVTLSDGTKLSDLANSSEDREILLSDIDMLKVLEKIKDNETEHFNTNGVLFGDKVLKRVRQEDEEKPPRNAPNMYSLLKKEPDFAYDYMPEFYRTFERVQKNRFPGAKCTIDYLQPPCIVSQERLANVPFPSIEDYENIRKRESYQYGIDFRSSYPCILHNAKLPTGGKFFPRSPELADNEFHTEVNTGYVDWYISYCDILAEGSLCSGELVRFCQEHLGMWAEFYYIGTSTCKIGSDMGAKLHEMAYRTKESKALIKYTHYGFADRPYLERIDFDGNGDCKAYALNETQNHQLLMCAIRSQQCLNVLKIMRRVYGDLKHGYVNADCLYFDFNGKISLLGDDLKKLLTGYDFRIFRNQDKNRILYRSYAPLPSEKDFKKLRKVIDKKSKM